MRLRLTLAVFALALGAGSRCGRAQDYAVDRLASRPASSPVVLVDFSDPSLSPSHWTLTLHPDGSGHFHSEMGKTPQVDTQEIDAPDIDRDVQLGVSFTSKVFEAAHHHKFFNEDCDSHLKVAFQGWKKLSYTGPEGSGSCTFNYSKDKEIQALGDSLGAVAETILEGARLEILLQHDRLGLDKEMEFLVDAAGNGRAQQICAIREILVRLAQDDEVLERVRKRARLLLAQGDS
ncbi:MAG TPA: hypothetical protein VGF96_10205 [Terracidiphilus sp.]|jgi:hypothetical protein